MPSKYNEHFGVGCVFCDVYMLSEPKMIYDQLYMVCVRPRRSPNLGAMIYVCWCSAKTALWFIIFQQKSFELGIQRCKFVINFAFFCVRDAVYKRWKFGNEVNVTSLFRELWRVKQQQNVITYFISYAVNWPHGNTRWCLIGHTRRSFLRTQSTGVAIEKKIT